MTTKETAMRYHFYYWLLNIKARILFIDYLVTPLTFGATILWSSGADPSNV